MVGHYNFNPDGQRLFVQLRNWAFFVPIGDGIPVRGILYESYNEIA